MTYHLVFGVFVTLIYWYNWLIFKKIIILKFLENFSFLIRFSKKFCYIEIYKILQNVFIFFSYFKFFIKTILLKKSIIILHCLKKSYVIMIGKLLEWSLNLQNSGILRMLISFSGSSYKTNFELFTLWTFWDTIKVFSKPLFYGCQK